MKKIILLLNTKAVKNNNIEKVVNFKAVDVSKINMEILVREEGKERTKEMIKIICKNNIKILEIQVTILKLKKKEKERRQREVVMRREKEER